MADSRMGFPWSRRIWFDAFGKGCFAHSAAITITRNDHDAAGFRRAAAASRDADAARRMLTLALVLEGASRADATRACGMDRQTLRDWVHRYNGGGL